MLHFNNAIIIVVFVRACLIETLLVSALDSARDAGGMEQEQVIDLTSFQGSLQDHHDHVPTFLNLASQLDSANKRSLKPVKSGKKCKSSKSCKTSSCSRSCKRSKKGGCCNNRNNNKPPNGTKDIITGIDQPIAQVLQPVGDPNLWCDHNCTLNNGATLSVMLNLNHAFVGIVPVSNKTTVTKTEEGGLRGLRNAARVQRELQESVTIPASFEGQSSLTNGNTATPQNAKGHFEYIIDVSGSVFEPSNGCSGPNVIDCELDAIKNVNAKLAADGNVASIAIIGFSDSVYPLMFGQTLFVPPSTPSINSTLDSLNDSKYGRGTSFKVGLSEALSLVKQAYQDASISSASIIFITDGESYENEIDEAFIQNFIDARARVHTFAVGDGSNCTDELHNISSKTGAGRCQFLKNPADLTVQMDTVFFSTRSLKSINVTLDSSEVPLNYSINIPGNTGLLPDQCPVTFTNVQSGMPVKFNATDYIHEVCATAMSNVSSDPTAGCCVKFALDVYLEGKDRKE